MIDCLVVYFSALRCVTDCSLSLVDRLLCRVSIANSHVMLNSALTSLSVPSLAAVSRYVTHLLDFDVCDVDFERCSFWFCLFFFCCFCSACYGFRFSC